MPKSSECAARFVLRRPGSGYLFSAAKVSEVSAVLRRSVLITVVVLITAGAAPADPTAAAVDPVAFIDALGNQLQVVTRNGSPEQTLRGLRELLREDFDVPALGRFVLGRFWRIFSLSRPVSSSRLMTSCCHRFRFGY